MGGFQARDLGQRQLGKKPQEAAHVGVVAVAPELPVIVRRELVGIQPIGAGGGLAHLGAARRRNQRCGQAIEREVRGAAAELDAIDDIAPLVGAAHLQAAAVAPAKFHEIISLQDHIVEFEEAERLLALEPELDALESQHAVDREMAAIFTEEGDV